MLGSAIGSTVGEYFLAARGYLFSVALKLIPDTELGAASHERCVWIQHDLAGVPAVTAFPAALSVYSEAI